MIERSIHASTRVRKRPTTLALPVGTFLPPVPDLCRNVVARADVDRHNAQDENNAKEAGYSALTNPLGKLTAIL